MSLTDDDSHLISFGGSPEAVMNARAEAMECNFWLHGDSALHPDIWDLMEEYLPDQTGVASRPGGYDMTLSQLVREVCEHRARTETYG